MIWNEEFETLSRARIEKLQLERLKALIDRLYSAVPFYRAKLDEAGVRASDITNISEISKLPFTTKEDLRMSYPFGLFAVPMDDVVRIHASSGTTGKPTVVGYTKNDIGSWAELMARTLACGGADKRDIVHNAYGYGLFTGGLGAHYGAEKMGTAVIPVSGGNSKRQVMIMQDFGSTVLLCTPSYALNLADIMKEMNVEPSSLKLRVGLFGAEPWTENMRNEIENKLDIKAIDIYGLSEIMGPGVASECIEEKNGLHVFEDYFMPEIIDPDTGEVLSHGETGELVFTTLTKEAFPVIRYRTKDITRLITDRCSCGRTFHRIQRVTGRSDDMLIIRGVNVFPSQIEHVLMSIEGVEPHYQIDVDRQDALDIMKVQAEVTNDIFSEKGKLLENLSGQIEREIKDLLGVSCKVNLVGPGTIQRSEGKAQRVRDNRNL